MWGTHSFNSVGARLRAAVGKVRETVSRNSVEYDDDEIETERPFAIETDYEEHSVPVETGEPAKILVRKQTSANQQYNAACMYSRMNMPEEATEMGCQC